MSTVLSVILISWHEWVSVSWVLYSIHAQYMHRMKCVSEYLVTLMTWVSLQQGHEWVSVSWVSYSVYEYETHPMKWVSKCLMTLMAWVSLRLAGNKCGHPAGLKKINLKQVKRNEPTMGSREIAPEWKLGVWASRAWWRYKRLKHLCETGGQDNMYSFTSATTRFGGATACRCPLRAHADFWRWVLDMKDPLCSQARLNRVEHTQFMLINSIYEYHTQCMLIICISWNE